ncbi:MAG: hypothetical protein ACI9TH_003964, partial [Kiritimatiellia bacterium]
SVPKVTRENGWFELFVGDVCVDIPTWAAGLEGDAKSKAIASMPESCRGKRVFFHDISDRFDEA